MVREVKARPTGLGRRVTLAESPVVVSLLGALSKNRGDGRFVFGGDAPITTHQVDRARKVMSRRFGAPPFTWRMLRRTCGTFLTCATGILGAASAFLSAKRLGHTVRVAERHYVGALTGIPEEARTLEAVMEIEDLAAEIVGRADGEFGSGPLASEKPRHP